MLGAHQISILSAPNRPPPPGGRGLGNPPHRLIGPMFVPLVVQNPPATPNGPLVVQAMKATVAPDPTQLVPQSITAVLPTPPLEGTAGFGKNTATTENGST